ncbi:sensor histidine kinase [Pararhodospirillum oryzae]|uniref:histidine kinase n=1 Tax=Pararhodospirillum oryzae TaxID=478448 RepID=A0A512HBQ2_9PROT|nr:PAS domain-containing sensor histidine kinase [Pararhodospirillum oryzae]GEO82820.1 histidine kinase [Pararhodospirillum oryzae]
MPAPEPDDPLASLFQLLGDSADEDPRGTPDDEDPPDEAFPTPTPFPADDETSVATRARTAGLHWLADVAPEPPAPPRDARTPSSLDTPPARHPHADPSPSRPTQTAQTVPPAEAPPESLPPLPTPAREPGEDEDPLVLMDLVAEDPPVSHAEPDLAPSGTPTARSPSEPPASAPDTPGIDTAALHAAWMAEAARHLGGPPDSEPPPGGFPEDLARTDDPDDNEGARTLERLREALDEEDAPPEGLMASPDPLGSPHPALRDDDLPLDRPPLAEALARRAPEPPGFLHRLPVGGRLALLGLPGFASLGGAAWLAHLTHLLDRPTLVAATGGAALVYGTVCWIFARSVTRPLNDLAQATSGLSIDASPALLPGLGRRDRFGAVARAVQDYRLTMEEQAEFLRQQADAAKIYLAAVLDGAPDALITIDQRGVIVGFNPGAEDLFGHPAPRAIGRPLTILMPGGREAGTEGGLPWFRPEDERERHNPVRRVLAQRADGSIFPAEIVVQEVSRENAGVLFVLFLRDQSGLEGQAHEGERTRRLADEARSAHSEVLNVLANELAYPVEAMNVALGSGRLDLERLEAGLGLLNAITNDIRGFANLEAGLVDLNFAPVELPALYDRVVDITREVADEFGLSLGLRVEPDAPRTVLGDEALIETVLANLFECSVLFNALDPTLHSSQPGGVALTARRVGEPGQPQRLRIEVGCDAKTVARAHLHAGGRHQPLVLSTAARLRLETGGRRGRTGLILVITKRLVQLMRGSIGMDTWPGRGTTLWIELET